MVNRVNAHQPRIGIEPITPGLEIQCSTNWANEAVGQDGLEPPILHYERSVLPLKLLAYWGDGIWTHAYWTQSPSPYLTWLHPNSGVNRNRTDIFGLQNQYSNLLNYNPTLLCIGLEPITFWLGIKRSTNWANKAKYRCPTSDLNRYPNIGLDFKSNVSAIPPDGPLLKKVL